MSKYVNILPHQPNADAEAFVSSRFEPWGPTVTAPIASPTSQPERVRVGSNGRERLAAVLEAILVARACPVVLDRLAAGNDIAQRTATMWRMSPNTFLGLHAEGVGAGLHSMRLADVARMMLREGTRASRPDELVRASFGHSSSDFPQLLQGVANKVMLAAFGEERTTYQTWCRVGSASDFKSMPMITLSEAQNLVEIPEGHNAPESTLNERAESIRLRTFGRRITMSRQMLLNDDLAAFAALPMMIGRAAARVPEDLAVAALVSGATTTMNDGVTFFNNATRGNMPTSGSALSQGSLEAAVTAMQLQRGFGADRAELEIVPRFLLVPTGLQFTAKALLQSQVKVAGTNGEVNTVQGIVEPVVSSRLHRASATAWYLTADPNVAPPVQVNFLNGQREPIITEVGDGSLLGLSYETIFDCGAALLQPEGAYRNPGA